MTTATGARVFDTASLFSSVMPIEQTLHDAHAITTSLLLASRFREDLSLEVTLLPPAAD